MPIENGQAPEAPETLESIADFLEENDNPDTGPDEEEKEQKDESDPEKGQSEDADAESDEPDAEDDESEDDPSQATQKFKVTVKGEDGTDQAIEVDQKELVDGYLRRRDYTVKTQQLAERERQAVEIVTQKVQEGRTHYLTQARVAHAAIAQLAGLKSEAEMQQLAATDATAWVQEKQRTELINGVLTSLRNSIKQEEAQAEQAQEMNLKQAFARSWETLSKQGFDKPKVKDVFENVAKRYGFEAKDFATVYDPRLVMLMRDAIAYQKLKEAKPEPANKKPVAAMPRSKQPVPRSERVNRDLNKRFQGGRAKVDDLAAFIANNDL